MGRYKIIPSQNVPNAGIYPIMLGYPIPNHTANDICLCREGSSEFIALNSFILREALLADPKWTESILGIRVADAFAFPKEEPKPEEPEGKPKPKRKRPEPIIEDLGMVERSDEL